MAANSLIAAIKHKYMKAMSIGWWYVQIPSGVVVDPVGNIVEPKTHNGSKFVLINRQRKAISKLPHLNKERALDVKEIFG